MSNNSSKHSDNDNTIINNYQDLSGDITEFLNMDDNERWKILVQRVTESKRVGTMSNQDLDNFYNAAQNYLSMEQLVRLNILINALKS